VTGRVAQRQPAIAAGIMTGFARPSNGRIHDRARTLDPMIFQSLAPLAEPSLTGLLLRSLLCSAYLWSGVTKLFQFNSTVAHFAARFKLPAPRTAVAVTILVQLMGSALVISGWMAWIGASVIAVFTVVATVIAYPFWKMTGIERARNIETCLEHVGLAAAFLIIAWPALSW